MSLFEVRVLKGEVSLFNPDRDNKPGLKTYANEAEMVGVYDMSLSRGKIYASLEFFKAMVVLNFGNNLSESEERRLPKLNSSTIFTRVENNLLLFSINVTLIADV